MIRRRIIFHGYVQGVGFRWRAQSTAQAEHCTGWARNEWDGSMVMEVQGSHEDVEKVLALMQEWRYAQIDEMQISEVPLVMGEKHFTVR